MVISARRWTIALLLLSVAMAGLVLAPRAARAVEQDDWLGEANYLRSFWNVDVPTLTEDPALSANNKAHADYLDRNQTCTHPEDPANVYYSEAGNYGGKHSVIYCAALGPKNDVDGWARTPLHGEQVLNPRLTVTGFAETDLNGGHAVMDTLTHYADGPEPATAATWPNGDHFPFTHYAGNELDRFGNDAVASNCPSEFAADQSDLGAPLFVSLPGPAHSATPASSDDVWLRDDTGTNIPVCLFDAASGTTFVSTAVLLPLHSFSPGRHYNASYTAGGFTADWSFTIAARLPTAPTDLRVTGTGNGTADLQWAAPDDDGGAAIDGYDVQYSDDGGSTWTSASDDFRSDPDTEQTITGLQNGVDYAFRVAAINAEGTGDYASAAASARPHAVAPGPPTQLEATAGNRSATVTWLAPDNDGGAEVDGYVVGYRVVGATTWTAAPASSGTATSRTITGLNNGSSYEFRVAAHSLAGTGPFATTSGAATPTGTAPGKPTMVSGRPGNHRVTVQWAAPADDGGSAVTSYDVQASNDGGASWQATPPTSGVTTSRAVTGLDNGVAYLFRVAAVNAIGAGEYASTPAALTPQPGPPEAPTGVTAAGGNGRVTLSWSAPGEDGGSAVTGYDVQLSRDSGPWTSASEAFRTNPATRQAVTGLDNGVPYRFRVAALNDAGASTYTAASAAVTPRADPPAAPTAVVAAARNGAADLTWTAPDENGGAAVTGYAVEYSTDGGANWRATNPASRTTSVTAATVAGLMNGTSYVFRVAAINSSGTGSYSASAGPVTPVATVPGAPTAVRGTVGDRQIAISWLAPRNTGGEPVLGYDIQLSTDRGASWRSLSDAFHSRPATSATVGGLVNGTAYVFRVSARNARGAGTYSTPSTALTPAAVRHRVALRIGAPQSVTYPARAAVSAVVSDASTRRALPRVRVTLLARNLPGAAWQTVAAAVSNSRGAVVVRRLQNRHVQYAWNVAQTPTNTAARSSAVIVRSRPTVSAKLRHKTVKVGRGITVTGTVRPGGTGARARLQVRIDGTWLDTDLTTAPSRTGTYRLRFAVADRGRYKLRVSFAATPRNSAAHSGTLKLRVK